jgi:asparagine synthase (glutamine-hydrolysing)
MCGIAGKLIFDRAARVAAFHIEAMLMRMNHRGPDAQGVHIDGSVGLGHLRLSIIDLNTGAQPMTNEDETVWIVFNGEIYNFPELRDLLTSKGHVFRSRSDTEVILHAYEEFGPDCVKRLRGMFAFAIWDSTRRQLLLARDRVGIKPLYYSQDKSAFWFASEVKGILGDSAVKRDVNVHALRMFLTFNYGLGQDTLLSSIRKVPPGHYLLVDSCGVSTHEYWDLRYNHARFEQPFAESVEELDALLKSTVRSHMMSDVPVGVLLSGGVDSSGILGLAVQATNRQLKTFTVGFDGDQVVDERPFARLAADRFGVEHSEISITPEDFWNFLPAYVWHSEEAVCEPPAVALHYVSKLARKHVKVVLSGEGGDEAFGGYSTYPNMLRLARFGNIAGAMSRTAGGLASLVGAALGHRRLQRYGYALGRPLAEHYFSRASTPTAFFNQNAQHILSDTFFMQTASVSAACYMRELLNRVADEPLLNQMLYLDTKTWLPDDLLLKADKMTMANSLELRVPLLDHVVIEFAASLPPQFKVTGRETKRLLKASLARTIPGKVLNRKKAGFPVPYQSWLRGELRTRVEDLLSSTQCAARGYFRQEQVAKLLRANAMDGRYSVEVFSLILIELWHRAFVDHTSEAVV